MRGQGLGVRVYPGTVGEEVQEYVRPSRDLPAQLDLVEGFVRLVDLIYGEGSTRWCTTLSSKVNLPCAINVRATSGANLVT